MNILSIGYVGFETGCLQDWDRFARLVLASAPIPSKAPDGRDALGVRFDEFESRFLITEGTNGDGLFFGFEVENEAALRDAASTLRRAGFDPSTAHADELAFRHVQGMIHFMDRDGYRIELFHKLARAAEPFAATRPISGYRMGALGFGHAVVVVPEMARARALYCDVLQFRLSDFISEPNLRVFLHVNERHHSFALAERDGHGIAHLMVEVNDFDDVGRTYDVALREYPEGIFSTLGRHSNDHMVSFYVRTPSGFALEYGWGGRRVDDHNWNAEEVFGPSLWGHDRVGGAPGARAAAEAQRQFAMDQGIRVPISPEE